MQVKIMKKLNTKNLSLSAFKLAFSLLVMLLLYANLNAQASPDSVECAKEGERCQFNGTSEVSYGADANRISRTVTGGIVCSNAAFGLDPAPGIVKTCKLVPTKCADEGGVCAFSGQRTVKYGANGIWTEKIATNGIKCGNGEIGKDPLPGVAKQCFLTHTPARRLQIVYVVPKGQTAKPFAETVLTAIANNIQRHFFEQLGVTFQLEEPLVSIVKIDEDAATAIQGDNNVKLIKERFRTGYLVNENVVITVFEGADESGIGGWNTVKIPGKSFFDGAVDTFLRDPLMVSTKLHVFSHELGHAFGLRHSEEAKPCFSSLGFTLDTSKSLIMQKKEDLGEVFNYPFLPEEKRVLLDPDFAPACRPLLSEPGATPRPHPSLHLRLNLFPRPEDQYLAGDWDGDKKSNLAVRRGNQILMDLNFAGLHEMAQSYGNGSGENQYLAGDWDGDGRDNIAVRRGNQILMDTNFDGLHDIAQNYGNGSGEDQYLVGDWDGDGRDNIAVRRGNQILMDTNFNGRHDIAQSYGNGNSEDQYLVGDWDGDGRDNIAVRRGSQILMDTNFDGRHDIAQSYGNGSGESQYLVGDWDGNGTDNIAVRRGNLILMDFNFDGLHDKAQSYGNVR